MLFFSEREIKKNINSTYLFIYFAFIKRARQNTSAIVTQIYKTWGVGYTLF